MFNLTYMRNKLALYPKYIIKRKKNTKCFVCGERIEVGSHYVSVNYIDGFCGIGYGAFHEQCWEEHLLTLK